MGEFADLRIIGVTRDIKQFSCRSHPADYVPAVN